EVVQRFEGPAAVGKLVDERARLEHIGRVVAERARGSQIKEACLRLARGALDKRRQRVARRAKPIEVVVALGDAKCNQLFVVARREACKRRETRSRLRPAPGVEDAFRAREFKLESVRKRGIVETPEQSLRVQR